MTLALFTKEDYLARIYRKSNSKNSRAAAGSALNSFELYCRSKGASEHEMISHLQKFVKEGDVRNACLLLDNYVQFLDEDHREISMPNLIEDAFFKRKDPKTIKTYFGFVKDYLRLCHDIRISTDDIKDFVQFPRLRREPRRAISIETIKVLLNGKPGVRGADPRQKALFLTLLSSGMRIGEAMALRKRHFHLNEDPVRITLEAEMTKTREGRETYITFEALEKLRPFLEVKSDSDKIFTFIDDIDAATNNEENLFGKLRRRLGLLEKYPNSIRYIVNIHALRSYCHTKASQKHGVEYANALDGHSGYLKQYYRLTPEERAKKYKELESYLLIETTMLETEKVKEKRIESLEEQVQKLHDQITRMQLLNKG